MGLTKYKVTIRTLGPVHIGGSNSLENSDYIFDPEKQLIHVINGRKFVRYLNRHHQLNDYLTYVENKGRRLNLYSYLTERSDLPDEWDEFIDYSMKIHEAEKNKLNTINPFIRDNLNHPYVPGSSLKGALRSVLVGNKRDQETAKLFGKIKVSDSEPLHNDSLVVYQKLDVNKKENPISLFRECIDAGEEIVTYVTVEDKAVSIQQLRQRLALYYKNYYDKWLSGFEKTEAGKVFFSERAIPDVVDSESDRQIIFLGGGVGFAYKTVHYQWHEKKKAKEKAFEQLQRSFPRLYGKFESTPANVPIVLKGARNTLTDTAYLQGACEISFEEVDSIPMRKNNRHRQRRR